MTCIDKPNVGYLEEMWRFQIGLLCAALRASVYSWPYIGHPKFLKRWLTTLGIAYLALYLFLLLLRAGDVETNPGPQFGKKLLCINTVEDEPQMTNVYVL